jgi:hypothetical protein
MEPETLAVNGVNGATGDFLLPTLTVKDVAGVALGERPEPGHRKELEFKRDATTAAHLGVPDNVDPRNLAQTGWGVVFASADNGAVAVRDALKPLLEHRKAQAGPLYKEYVGHDAYRPDETKRAFLARHGMGPGLPKPSVVPYYLLLVGSPEFIPFSFQYQLDVQYAVGRVHFPRLEDYALYAASVVDAERGVVSRQRRMTFFGVANPDDPATALSSRDLITPLASHMAGVSPDWSVETRIGDDTKKKALADVLADEKGPALLFTASHGMGFPKDDKRQAPHQGALLCQDWPGPDEWGRKPIPVEHYFSADDVGEGARVGGLISFFFACYGAGAPELDDFPDLTSGTRAAIAPHPFVAALPQRLLSQPQGALAVIGHVERAWGCSFVWARAGRQSAHFEAALERLLNGHPVGSAMEFFNERYAELGSDLHAEQEDVRFGKERNDVTLAGLWTATNDARSYVIVGDPAVRLATGSLP